MKINILIAAKNQGDGSIGLFLCSKKQDALDYLQKTEEELEAGSPYDDGLIESAEIDVDEQGDIIKGKHLELDGI